MLKPSEVVGRNVRAGRALRDLSQEQLAEVMVRLGHDWKTKTVGAVENATRRVDVDELYGLALALGRSIPELLEISDSEGVWLGTGRLEINPRWANRWAQGTLRLWAHGYDEENDAWIIRPEEIEP